jgi:hypothetical protein
MSTTRAPVNPDPAHHVVVNHPHFQPQLKACRPSPGNIMRDDHELVLSLNGGFQRRSISNGCP